MKKITKIALGAVTLWPPVWMVLFFLFMIGLFFLDNGRKTPAGQHGAPLAMMLFFGLHFLTILVIFALIAFYLVHLFKHSNIPEDKRVIWLLVILLGGVIGAPVYWYLHIWKAPESNEA